MENQKGNKIKITLISPYDRIVAQGLRVISSYLKKHGHKVDLIFLPTDINLSDHWSLEEYNQQVINDLAQICKSSDLIGISLMTNYFVKIRNLTVKLKDKLNKPILWGGIHPTVKPEECLNYADMVCIGEGEEAMLELANKWKTRDILNIQNIWIKTDKEVIKNEIRPLEENIDKYPLPDYDLNTHYILKEGRIIKMTPQLLADSMPKHPDSQGNNQIEYYINTVRNCPHNCAYCCNNALRKLYKKGKFVRKKSIQKVIEELEMIKKDFDFIGQLLITDDTFFIRSKEEIKEFSRQYKKKIGWPIRCNVSPLTLTEEKLKPLIDAGLFWVSMGIQSYNYETLKLYKRPTSKERIMGSIQLLEKYKQKLPHPFYHLIIDNPYETKQSIKENINFVLSLPERSKVFLFPLSFFPGTELYYLAKKDRLFKDEIKEIYLKSWKNWSDLKKPDYLTYLLYFVCADTKFTKSQKKKIINILLRKEMEFLLGNKHTLRLLTLLYKIIKFF